MPLGLNSDGTVQVPPLGNHNLAGWYDGSVTPGQDGSAVILGHVDNYAGPSVFYGVKNRPVERSLRRQHRCLRPPDQAGRVRSRVLARDATPPFGIIKFNSFLPNGPRPSPRSQLKRGAGRRPQWRAPRVIRQKGQVVQVAPLSVNAVGVALLLVQLPWKPSVTEPLTGMEPL